MSRTSTKTIALRRLAALKVTPKKKAKPALKKIVEAVKEAPDSGAEEQKEE